MSRGGDRAQLFTVLRGLWVSHCSRGKFRAAHGLGEELLGLAQRENDAALLAEAHWAMSYPSMHLGDPEASLAHADKAVALYRSREHRTLAWRHGQDPGVASLDSAAVALWYLGYSDQALARVRQSVALARELAQAHAEAMALASLALVHQLRREAATAQRAAEAAMKLSTDLGFPLYETWGLKVRGWALVVQGQGEEGVRQMEDGLLATEAIGVETYRSYHLARLAEAHAHLGRIDDGLRVLRRALEVMDEDRIWEAETYRLQGDLALLQAGIKWPAARVGGWRGEATASSGASRIRSASRRPGGRGGPEAKEAESRAEVSFQRAIDVARLQKARALELRAATSLAWLWHRQERRFEARDLLEPVYAWFTEGFDTADLVEAKQLAETLA